MITIRAYQPKDCHEMAALFYDTVHSVNVKDYTKEQLAVWATKSIPLADWHQSFLAHYTLVALENHMIVGFGDIDKTGYLDRLYVHQNHQGKGIATALCDKLEKAFFVANINTHASITAKPFFEKRRYQVIQVQEVKRRGVKLKHYRMKKSLIQDKIIENPYGTNG